VIPLRPLVDLRGRVVTSGAARLPEKTSLSLRYMGSFRLAGVLEANVDAGGEFTFKGLVAGVYRLWVTQLPDTFVADIRQGDRSIYSDGLVRVDGDMPEPVQVVMAANPGNLSGTVVHPDGKKGADTTAVLVPEGPLRANVSFYRVAQAGESGQFTIKNVAPGRYKLFAWESVPASAWNNAQFLAKYEDVGVAVTVAAGDNPGLRVPVSWPK
jgi:hypothetical protein